METKIPFKTPYGKKERVHCPEGERTRPIWEYEIDSKGRKKLVITGEENIYEQIQAELEDCKIENILAKVAVGDMSNFRPDGIYQDITDIPNNLIEARQEMQKVENLWKNLPSEIKAKYNWSVDEYMAAMGEKSWLIDSGFIQPDPEIDETITSEALQVETKVETPQEE